MPPIRMDIILYAQTVCAIISCTKINDGINFELNTQSFLPPIVTGKSTRTRTFLRYSYSSTFFNISTRTRSFLRYSYSYSEVEYSTPSLEPLLATATIVSFKLQKRLAGPSVKLVV